MLTVGLLDYPIHIRNGGKSKVITGSTNRQNRLVAGICGGVLAFVVATPVFADQKLTWFGETNFAGAYPDLNLADPTAGSTEWLSQKTTEAPANQFSIDRFGSYRSLSSLPLDGALRTTDLDPIGNVTQVQSEVGFSVGRESFLFPVEFSRSLNDERTRNALGVKWRHQFGDSSHLTVGASYGNSQYSALESVGGTNSSSKLATVSWTSSWAGAGEREVTGSLFFGDEKARNGTSIDVTRQVYGLSVGGKWAISAAHTPFVSYRYQTGYGANGASDLFEFDNATHLSAGWNWKVNPNWSIQAEADFSYQQPTLDLLNVNNTRLFFKTRYDFR